MMNKKPPKKVKRFNHRTKQHETGVIVGRNTFNYQVKQDNKTNIESWLIENSEIVQ